MGTSAFWYDRAGNMWLLAEAAEDPSSRSFWNLAYEEALTVATQRRSVS